MKQKQTFHFYGAVAATGLLSFTGVLIETAMNVTFPTLIGEFGISTTAVQWVTTICLLAISIIAPLSSYLNRSFSARALFLAANLLFLGGAVLDCFSPGFAALLLGRVLQGVGTGLALPLMFYMILTKSPLEIRGRMMGFGTLTTSIAPAIGPTYGGMLAHLLNWRSIFVFILPILVGSLLLGLHSIPKTEQPKREPLHGAAIAFLAVFFTCFLTAFTAKGLLTAVWLLAGLAAGALFLRANRRHSLLGLAPLRNRSFTLLMVSFLLYQALLLGNSFVLPNVLQIAGGLNASAAGLFMFPGAMLGAVLAPVSGWVLDRLGAKKPILIGLAVAAGGMVLLALLLHTAQVALLVAAHCIFMTGLGLSYSNLMTCSLARLPQAQLSDGNAVLNTLQQFIGAMGTATSAFVISLFQQSGGYRSGTMLGGQTMLGIFACLLLVSFLCSFLGLHLPGTSAAREPQEPQN
ncbi:MULTISPECIES: MFS transporter [Caproicibacterium]|uniref:MFS transporter n=1 Tax=Caproicibacterium argilliputei TaxID=3030016 RepID=A0AA97DCZ6_9FIRM|nr:MFS transporter [Caproicibacterium argilliputei]WOC33201.1 MFS transporter [Caproicibacterium argilliputei]